MTKESFQNHCKITAKSLQQKIPFSIRSSFVARRLLSHDPRTLPKRDDRSRELPASQVVDRLGDFQIIDKGELALDAAIVSKPEIYSVNLGGIDFFVQGTPS